MKIFVFDSNLVIGFVNYGSIEVSDDGEFNPYEGAATKMRCYKCGAAWLAENYIGGDFICPTCGTADNRVKSVR